MTSSLALATGLRGGFAASAGLARFGADDVKRKTKAERSEA
jgi:hypothetical protein